MLSTERRRDTLALAIFALLALWFLREALATDVALVSRESLQNSLPWSAVLEPQARNRFLGDQPRIYYPYLLEAAKVYAGEADALWTTRGGGGQPFLGNITSSLLHPLTLLAAVVPAAKLHLLPTLQAFLVLVLSAWFTWLFLRRLELAPACAALGAVSFAFGGHQVLWLQYALSHTLMALPFTCWAVERVVELRSRRRVACLALGFALLIVGGHPETGFVAGLVAGLWALWRLWDAHGRPLVVGAALLGLALAAVQWMPFLEYAGASHGKVLREIEAARLEGSASFGVALVYGVFFLVAVVMLRAAAAHGAWKRILAIASCTVALVMARRMGMSVASLTLVAPELYGHPRVPQPGDWLFLRGIYTGAQDFPGLAAGYVGVLPPILLALGFFAGVGGGFVRFFTMVVLFLWGSAHDLPGIEGIVQLIPGLDEVGSTRLLGPVGFASSCGGAYVLHRITRDDLRPGALAAVGRVALTAALALGVALVVLRMPVDPHGGRTIISNLRSPDHTLVHDGRRAIPICLDLAHDVDDLRIQVDGETIRRGPAPATSPGEPFTMLFAAQRTEDGRHRLVVEAETDGQVEVLADQPLAIGRGRQLAMRDLLAVSASLFALSWFLMRHRRRSTWVATLVVAVDVLSLGDGYNVPSPVSELYPRTGTTDFLAAQPGPFRIFTEGTILPPDTQFVVGVDHLMTYDNLGYDRTYKWIRYVEIDMDHFATFSFSKDSVQYESPRFDALDVKYVLTAPRRGARVLPPDETGQMQLVEDRGDLSHVPGMELVHSSEVRIWENTDNLGRAWVVGRALDIDAEPTSVLLAADPADTALLEQPFDEPLGGSGTARVVSHRGSEIDVEVETDGPALLVVAENKAPGWVASVDEGPWQPTLACDVAWQAVAVPEGSSSVRLRYDPPAWRWGVRISLGAALLCLWMLLRPRHGV